VSRIDLASVVVCCEDFQTVSLHNVGRASVADNDDTPSVELRPPSAITTAVQAAVSRSIVGRAASALKHMGMLRTRLPRVVAVPSRFHRGRSACVACVFVRASLARGHPHDIRPASSVLAAATAAVNPGKPGSKPKRVKVFASPMSLSWIADPATKHGNAEVIIGATGQLQVRQAAHRGCVVATGSSCCQEQAKSKKGRNRKQRPAVSTAVERSSKLRREHIAALQSSAVCYVRGRVALGTRWRRDTQPACSCPSFQRQSTCRLCERGLPPRAHSVLVCRASDVFGMEACQRYLSTTSSWLAVDTNIPEVAGGRRSCG